MKELEEGLDRRLETASRLVSGTAMRRVEDVDFRARIHRAESEIVRCSENGRRGVTSIPWCLALLLLMGMILRIYRRPTWNR